MDDLLTSGAAMEFLSEYSQYIGELLSWLSNPDTTIPVVRLLQGLAAIIGALISTFAFVRAWRYAESRLGDRLSEFIKKEEKQIASARETVRKIRGERSAVAPSRLEIFTNAELRKALRQVRGRRAYRAEALLIEAIAKTKERETLARDKAVLHEKQRAMTHLLLGAIEDSRNDHRAALAHFQAALEIDEHDTQAREYVGLQLLKLGDPHQAAEQFEKVVEIAQTRGDKLLLAHAYRNCGLAEEAPPNASYFNANVNYRDAIEAFPHDGPPLDIAHIHELRGLANMKLRNNRGQAHNSLTSALTRYSQLELAKTRDSREAAKGVKRIHAALKELEQLHTAARAQTDSDISPTQPAVPPSVVPFRSAEQQAADQPPGRERSN